MAFDAESVAACFGLELARLVLDACYRDFAIARYESEKKYIREQRARGRADLPGAPAATHVSIIYFLVLADFDFVAVAVSSLAS